MKYFYTILPFILLLFSCKKDNEDGEYTAYFGGEVLNPNTNFILLYKDNTIIDTLFLNEKNIFFKKFDSLAAGMYKFVHDSEYQYVFFDKNDSLLVRINTIMFDKSLVFTGKGDKKNNFLINQYNNIEKDKYNYFETFDYSIPKFNSYIDSIHYKNKKYYLKRKEEINWGENFDKYAKATYEYSYHTKKEFYPLVYQIRNGKSIINNLPEGYYNYRKKIDFNDEELCNYSPFIQYLTAMLNNMAYCKSKQTEECSFINNINKLYITDSIFKNKNTKNVLLKKLALIYFMQDQDIDNNKEYINTFQEISTDKKDLQEINLISENIKNLASDNFLPNIKLENSNNKIIDSKNVIAANTVIYFWDINFYSHYNAVHKKINVLKSKFPNYIFVGICIENNSGLWKSKIKSFKINNVNHFRTTNIDTLADKWYVNKIHRTIVIGSNGKIKNAFTSIFENEFENELK